MLRSKMPRVPGDRPTIVDVARLAGVSVATASRSLNGRSDVHPDTRRSVTEAAGSLGFQLRPRKRKADGVDARTVGLLTSDPGGRFSMAILGGAEDALGAGAIEVLLCASRNDPIRERHYVATLLNRAVDGIIVVGDRTNERLPIAMPTPIPVVYAFAPSSDPGHASFVPDDVEGGRLAVEHLLAIGRRRIAHITGPDDWASARDRADGATRELAGAGLEPVGGVRYGADWTQAWGRTAAAMLLRDHPDVDAVFCGSDQIAVGVMDTVRASGRSIPTDVAIVGYDNWEVFAVDARPTLTSVDMGLDALGRAAARAMFDAIDSQHAHGLHRQPPRIVIRESTASW
jgi:LacI family transcriptional regulator